MQAQNRPGHQRFIPFHLYFMANDLNPNSIANPEGQLVRPGEHGHELLEPCEYLWIYGREAIILSSDSLFIRKD